MSRDFLLALIPIVGYMYYTYRSYLQFKKKEYNPNNVIIGDSLIGLSPFFALHIITNMFIRNIMLLIIFILMVFIAFINFKFYKCSGQIKSFILSIITLVFVAMLLSN